MQKAHFDHLLNVILDSHEGIADLFFIVGRPFQVEAFGKLKPVAVDPPIPVLTPFHVERIVNRLVGHDPRLVRDLVESGSCDSSYAVGNRCRLRVNIFRQRGNYGVVMRILATKIPTIDALNLPPIFSKMTGEKTGLILVTGATGSRQDDHARRAAQRVQRKAARPHRHAGRPHRVRPSAQDVARSASANWATISTRSPSACARRCARRRR